MKKQKKQRQKSHRDLFIPDPEDRDVLRGKPPNYIRGWNQVKYSKEKKS